MDIHKPKPWGGWREFVKEIGTIVIGVLIAIGAEQMVEALNHHAKAEEMADKLRAEGQENRHVVAYDIQSLRAALTSTDAALAALAGNADPTPLREADLFKPADAAWVAIRDSALLPIMPKRLTDNAWKVDAINDYLTVTTREIDHATDQAEAALAVLKATPGDAELRRTARLRLAELRVEEARLIGVLGEFQHANEQMVRGELIDAVAAIQRAQAARK